MDSDPRIGRAICEFAWSRICAGAPDLRRPIGDSSLRALRAELTFGARGDVAMFGIRLVATNASRQSEGRPIRDRVFVADISSATDTSFVTDTDDQSAKRLDRTRNFASRPHESDSSVAIGRESHSAPHCWLHRSRLPFHVKRRAVAAPCEPIAGGSRPQAGNVSPPFHVKHASAHVK